MRGGLGRTLLTAFLVLAIVPLSLISWYATQRERYDIQREVTAKLASVATMMETQVRQWVENRQAALALVAALPATQESARVLAANAGECAAPSHCGLRIAEPSRKFRWGTFREGKADCGLRNSERREESRRVLRGQLQALLAQDPAWGHLAVLDSAGRGVLASADEYIGGTDETPSPQTSVFVGEGSPISEHGLLVTQRITSPDQAGEAGDPMSDGADGYIGPSAPWAYRRTRRTVGLLVGALKPGNLVQTMEAVSGLGETGEIYLVDRRGIRWVGADEYIGTPMAVGAGGLRDCAREYTGCGLRIGNMGADEYMGTLMPQGRAVTSAGIQAALAGLDREGLEENYAGVPVIGVYRWIPELNLALVAEQAQEEAFATTDTVTAAVVGATLGVALFTAVIAAVVTQQITRPIVRLTESALNIADGRLETRVPVTSRDEIGILAYVFNRMAGELKTLYDDLEEKVVQRTALLQKANYQIQRRAIQLATTVEVSQAATSILEPEQLLREVVLLIRDRFAYTYVGIYLLSQSTSSSVSWALLQEGVGGNERLAAAKARPVRIADCVIAPVGTRPWVHGAVSTRGADGGPSGEYTEDVGPPVAVGQAVLTGKPSIVRVGSPAGSGGAASSGGADSSEPSRKCGWVNLPESLDLSGRWRVGDEEQAEEVFCSPYIRAELALPLKIGDERQGRMIGVLDILSTDAEDFDADDVSVLQTMANQITIALENARAYAVEREAAKRLRELDHSKRRFLGHMSHELRTPLTNIIGFSRLMLKGIGGPLTEQQVQDVQIIYHNGQHLLGLINDLLDVSQIEAGLMELEFREVSLADLIHSVMSTASALVRDKEIELRQEIAPDLPKVQADEMRIREVLLRLLANAARLTEQGAITVRSWQADSAEGRPQVFVSVSDTSAGIPPEDQERVFEYPNLPEEEMGKWVNGDRSGRFSPAMALSKEFVEMHGGRMWVESAVNKGSTFTFTLPLERET